MEIQLTFDVESDNRSSIQAIIKFLDKHRFKAIFFVPAKILESSPKLFLEIAKKGYKIGLHGYKHERFDILNTKEKNQLIKKSIETYKKIFNKNPEYFRAPQFSLDKELLNILNKNNFKYDYSTTQLPLFQAIFFPTRIFLYLHQTNIHSYIKKNKLKINEIQNSSFILPISMFSLRILPSLFFQLIAKISTFFRKDKKLIFLMHSYEINNKNLIKLEKILKKLK